MTLFEQLDRLLELNQGLIQTSQVIEAGISKPLFYDYVKKKKMEKVSHGVYVMPDVWVDAMYLLHLRCGQAIFSHENALFFHDLTDREPLQYVITVKTGYIPSKLKKDGIQVYTIKKELHEVGTEWVQTPFGNEVLTYNMERTVCDVIRSRSNMEMQIYQDALKQYFRRRNKNLRRLMEYAALFHVERILRQYQEVLL